MNFLQQIGQLINEATHALAQHHQVIQAHPAPPTGYSPQTQQQWNRNNYSPSPVAKPQPMQHLAPLQQQFPIRHPLPMIQPFNPHQDLQQMRPSPFSHPGDITINPFYAYPGQIVPAPLQNIPKPNPQTI